MQPAWSIRVELKFCFVFSEVRWFSKGPLRLLFSFLGPKDSFTTMLPKQDVIHPQAGELSITHISKGKLGPNTTQLHAASQSILSMECALCLHLAYVCDEISFYLLNSHQICYGYLRVSWVGDEDVDLGHFLKKHKTPLYFVLGYSWLTVSW